MLKAAKESQTWNGESRLTDPDKDNARSSFTFVRAHSPVADGTTMDHHRFENFKRGFEAPVASAPHWNMPVLFHSKGDPHPSYPVIFSSPPPVQDSRPSVALGGSAPFLRAALGQRMRGLPLPASRPRPA
eukprot:CAMPEP_0113661900 /NCGR_PEP_ID=MMETSP0038_2-20120614/255_1 /TAXON_ID=2898 /ORGANISM="Cryptomonas paramecium" /LENGTH=129 /DNA_ID=CAMNT_0000576691 /DNA_START=320 /DNA_END=706 /DNA_ORIENTATION=+ /assembly_acc=CAM_ASM_000170